MARQGRLTAAKRERERALAERRLRKLARRMEPKPDRQASDGGAATGVDLDIAAIVPGPQPPLWWQVKE